VSQESEDEGDTVGEENHFFTPDDLPTYITEEEELVRNSIIPQDEHYILSNDAALEEESEEYQRGYLNALSAQQRQLRNRVVPINPIQKRTDTSAKNGSAAPQKKGKEISDPPAGQSSSASKIDQPSSTPTDKVEKREIPAKEGEKISAFSLENEISKLKVSIPLTEIMKNSTYRGQISKMLNFDPMLDTVNVEDDQPELIFGPSLNGESPESDVPPFYISLRLHEYVLHNAMFDSGALHNLMPKAIMEKLGLDITRKYHDLYSFDSSRVKCIGLIKDLVVSLDQIPAKNVLMDVVVADIPPRFGMLLSRSWGAKLKGTLQLDFSYATIPVFGQMRKLYREQKMKYMITSKEKPVNHLVNYVHTDLESFVLFAENFNEIDSQLVQAEDILYITENFREILRKESEERSAVIESTAENNGQQTENAETTPFQHLEDDEDGLWTMDFDGAVGSDGAGIGVWIRSPFSVRNKVPSKVRVCSYKLAFDCSNNEAEYEALIAGLKILRKLKAKKIAVYGDSELVIKQVKGEFQAKHPRMRAYRNAVLDILKLFSEHTLTCVPRIQNGVADALAKAASNLKIPMNSSNKFEIYVKHHPTVPDNQRCWQVFQDDEEIKDFLQVEGEFKDISIDTEPEEVNQMDVFQLKDNFIPKGLIPLEELFDQDDVARKPTLRPTEEGVEEVNIGAAENPKMVKLSKALTPKVKKEYIRLLSSFSNVFAWDYSDLKTYDTSIIQHTIPIKPNQKPFRQKLKRMNPKLLPLIEKEVNRLYKSRIIVPIRFSDWISNLVPVRKKTGEICLCIDFRNLNKVSLKDNYPLPKMDHILQQVVGASRMSLLDGYSGYNQILVHEDDRDKIAFTTPWGTFHYAKMPFGLKNAGATFQRAMDMAFANEKDVFLVVYLDDLTVFSKSDEEHLYHLTMVFQKCRKYGISLNPKKSLFAMSEGKLLGHIISKDGIRIDPARVEAIQ